jgi:hypothetical protein
MHRVRCRKCRQRFVWEGPKEQLKECILCHSTMIDTTMRGVCIHLDDDSEKEGVSENDA